MSLRNLLCKLTVFFFLTVSFVMYFLSSVSVFCFNIWWLDENREEWYPGSTLKCSWKMRAVTPLPWSRSHEVADGCCWLLKNIATSSVGKVLHNYHLKTVCCLGWHFCSWSQLVTRIPNAGFMLWSCLVVLLLLRVTALDIALSLQVIKGSDF